MPREKRLEVNFPGNESARISVTEVCVIYLVLLFGGIGDGPFTC